MDAVQLWGNTFDSAACLAWIPCLNYLKLDVAVQEIDGTYTCVRAVSQYDFASALQRTLPSTPPP